MKVIVKKLTKTEQIKRLQEKIVSENNSINCHQNCVNRSKQRIDEYNLQIKKLQ